jgi:Leucine-rich repeat (LRR) protein
VQLDLSVNRLSGSIPRELVSLDSLNTLALNQNYLSGTIHPEFSSLSQELVYFELYGNQLTGTLPFELSLLTNLKGLGLSANQLTGTLPPSYGNMSVSTSFELSGNYLSGTIPTEFGRIGQFQSNFAYFMLDDNNLSGSIPSMLKPLDIAPQTHELHSCVSQNKPYYVLMKKKSK